MASNGNKKHGRNAKWCEQYKLRSQSIRNKIKRLIRRCAMHPNDKAAARQMELLHLMLSDKTMKMAKAA